MDFDLSRVGYPPRDDSVRTLIGCSISKVTGLLSPRPACPLRVEGGWPGAEPASRGQQRAPRGRGLAGRSCFRVSPPHPHVGLLRTAAASSRSAARSGSPRRLLVSRGLGYGLAPSDWAGEPPRGACPAAPHPPARLGSPRWRVASPISRLTIAAPSFTTPGRGLSSVGCGVGAGGMKETSEFVNCRLLELKDSRRSLVPDFTEEIE